MKSTAIFAFFSLVATAFSASIDLSSLEGVTSSSTGNATVGAAADSKSGAASGALDGPGAVVSAASVGGALSSPYL